MCHYVLFLSFFFFFFSSRRRHTRSLRDWSSDVCSSDLPGWVTRGRSRRNGNGRNPAAQCRIGVGELRKQFVHCPHLAVPIAVLLLVSHNAYPPLRASP